MYLFTHTLGYYDTGIRQKPWNDHYILLIEVGERGMTRHQEKQIFLENLSLQNINT